LQGGKDLRVSALTFQGVKEGRRRVLEGNDGFCSEVSNKRNSDKGHDRATRKGGTKRNYNLI